MFNKPSKKLILSFTMIVGLLVIFTFVAYSSHEFPGEPYRDDFRNPLIQKPANDFAAGPYRSDFDRAVRNVYGSGFSAGPYMRDFNSSLTINESSGATVAGPYRSDFANLRAGRGIGKAKETIGGPYRADFDEIRSE